MRIKNDSEDAAVLQQNAGAYHNTLTLLTCKDVSPEGGYASGRINSAKPVE